MSKIATPMNAKSVIVTAAQTTGVFAALGLVVGSLMGISRESKRLGQLEMARMSLPGNLNNFPEFSEPLLQLAQIRGADLNILRRVARKCSNLLILYTLTSEAQPNTVKPSIMSASRQFASSVDAYLRDFYRASNIALVPHNLEDGTRTMVPAARELRQCHELITSTAEGFVHNLSLVVKTKMEQAAADGRTKQ